MRTLYNIIIVLLFCLFCLNGVASTINFDDFYKDGDDGVVVMKKIIKEVKALNGKSTTIAFSKKTV